MNDNTELSEMQNGDKGRGATLVWRKVSVLAKERKNGRGNNHLKHIISNSTGFIQPATLMAVMGPRLANAIFQYLNH